MEDRFIFDKRVMKRIFKKYGLMALGIFPVLCIINYFLNKVLSFWLTIAVDVAITLLIVFVVESIINAIQRRKEESTVRDDDIVIKKAKEIKERRKKD